MNIASTAKTRGIVHCWRWTSVVVIVCLGTPCSGQARPERGSRQEEHGEKASVSSRGWASLGLGGGGAMFTPAISPVDSKLMLLNCDMSGAYRSTDGGSSWELIHHRQLTSSTTVHPVWHPADRNVAFAAGGWNGPLKVSRDQGRTWNEIPDGPAAITAIGIDPNQPSFMLVGTRRGITRTTDGGKTWSGSQGGAAQVLGFHLDRTSPTASRTCFAATQRAVLRSDDGGSTWRTLDARPGPGKILSFAGGSNAQSHSCVLYCSLESREAGGQVTGGIYRSIDRGSSWTRAMGQGIDVRIKAWDENAESPAQYEFVLTTDVDPDLVYASLGSAGRVYRSDDRGEHWHSMLHQSMRSADFNVGPNYLIDERGGGGDNISGFAINPADPGQLIVGDWMDCYVTRNGGKTWDAAHTRLSPPDAGRGKGLRWLNPGLVVTTVWNYYLDPFEPNRHYIAYTDIGFARSTDAGKSWYWLTGKPLRNTTYELAFDPESPGKIWAAFADLHDIPNGNVITGRHYFARAAGGVGVSTDFGATWTDATEGLPRKPITSVIVDPKSSRQSRTLYASAFDEGVFKSTDGGRTWVKSSNGLGAPDVNMRVCRLILHADGTLFCLVTALMKDRQFVSQGPGLYRSADGGSTWKWINRSHPLLWPKDFDIDPRDSRVIYLGAADARNEEGGLYKTSDGGASWMRVARKSSECFGATVHPRKPGWVYMCLTEGDCDCALWLSKDSGNTWKPLDGLPFQNAQRVSFDPKDDSVIYVSTFGASVWRGPAE